MLIELTTLDDMLIDTRDKPSRKGGGADRIAKLSNVNARARCVADAESPGQAERPSATVSHRGGSRMTAPFRYAPPEGVASEKPARHLPLVQGGQGLVVSAFVVVGAIVAAMLVVAWEVVW